MTDTHEKAQNGEEKAEPKRRWYQYSLRSLLIFMLVTGALSAWVYDYYFRVPTGPDLPSQPEGKNYSKDVIALNDRAVKLYFFDSDFDTALKLYDEAIEKDPGYYPAIRNKGQMLFKEKKYAEAAECYATAISLQPRTPEYYMAHAMCLNKMGLAEKARISLLKALSAYNYAMEKSPFHARLNRTLVLFLLGNKFLAYRELDLLEDQAPDLQWQQVVRQMRKSMEEIGDGDPWTLPILGN